VGYLSARDKNHRKEVAFRNGSVWVFFFFYVYHPLLSTVVMEKINSQLEAQQGWFAQQQAENIPMALEPSYS